MEMCFECLSLVYYSEDLVELVCSNFFGVKVGDWVVGFL